MTSAVWTDSSSECTVRAGAASHIGYFRENNEDCVYLDPEHPFALVLDGMGGLAAGELASRNGADAVAHALRVGLAAGAEPSWMIEQAIRAGHEAVRNLGQVNRDYRNAGTTVVLALLHRDRVYVSWLGDSPAYRVTGESVEKLTWEHNLSNALVRGGVISAEEARENRINNMLWRYLGSEEAKEPVEVASFVPRRGDRLVLATDGVSGVVSDAILLHLCRAHPEPRTCAEELVNGALARGSRDNCTCAVLAFEAAGSDPAQETPHPRMSAKWWRFWK